MNKTPAHLLLVDGSNLMSRAWYVARSLDRLPSLVGSMLAGAVRRWECTHLIFALDSPECFRRNVIPGYKSDRIKDGPSTHEMTDALRPELERWGVAIREAPHHEADDVIAAVTLAAVQNTCAVSILTRDTDLLQLVNDANRVRVLWPTGNGEAETVMDEAAIADYLTEHKQIGSAFPPARLLDLRAIAGGKDNLPRIEVREGSAPFGFTTRRTASLLADGVTLEGLRDKDAWRLTPKETVWVRAGWDDAMQRYDALNLRSYVQPVASGGKTAVAGLRLPSGTLRERAVP